ncbi:MAG: 2OG-Fe dioxygenase family protein [Stanieria sp.]
MQKSFINKGFNCLTDYALETINSVNLDRLTYFFSNLKSDPYLKEKYRFRRLSRFQIVNNQIVKLPHNYLFQSKKYNPLLGDIIREYPEIEDELIELKDFAKIVLEFYEFCQLCSDSNEIAVHQIRTTTSAWQRGQPAPEGIHRDGVDLVGIFCVNRHEIEGGITSLYRSKNDPPMLSKILNPGEFLIFNDEQFFHYTSAITALPFKSGIRDVFVLTCPGLLPPAN